MLDSIAQNGCKLGTHTFNRLLECCIRVNSVRFGRELHARLHLVDEVNPFVETKLVSMYAKCGCLDDARKVFDEMSERNLFTWSAMIGAYSRKRRWHDVVGLFRLMMRDGVLPDAFLLPKILQACGNCGDYETGRLIHSLVVRKGWSSRRRVSNALLAVYAKCGRLSLPRRFFQDMDERDRVSRNLMILGSCHRGENDEAHKLFDVMCEEGIEPGLITWNTLVAGYNRSGYCEAAMELMKKIGNFGVTPDVFTWTSMISGLAQNNRIDEALELFREMLLIGVQPNGVTIASAIAACASLKSLEKGKALHSFAVKIGLYDNVLVGNAIIDMYSKCGELEAAHEVFNQISEKDIYTWNSMIAGYCQHGYFGKAYDIFMKLQQSEVQPSFVTWNLMISGFLQNGDEYQAMDLFQKMGKGGIVEPDTSSWNSLISGYLHIGQKNRALGVFRRMQSLAYRPNLVTILAILPACANLIAVNKVKEIHAYLLRQGLDSQIAILNALIDTYAKSGNIVYSRWVFDQMMSKDVITWNSLVAGYVLHGCPDEALDTFDQMRREEYTPNGVTLLNLILAYSRAKMFEKGKQVFHCMTTDYQITPGTEHYSAMVDLFGRSGKVKDAIEFIGCMELEPDAAVWEALLTAHRCHGNVALTIHPCEHLLKLNPANTMANHLVTQAQSLDGRSVNPLKEKSSKGHKYTRKDCGCSLLEFRNMVYVFVSGDRSPGLNSVYDWLKSIAVNIKLSVSNTMLGIHEEEEEEICEVHSEKLALGFALVRTDYKVKCIRIVKNLRICEECHYTAKYISSSYGCDILLHDSKCLHHFKNGRCSCGDYW